MKYLLEVFKLLNRSRITWSPQATTSSKSYSKQTLQESSTIRMSCRSTHRSESSHCFSRLWSTWHTGKWYTLWATSSYRNPNKPSLCLTSMTISFCLTRERTWLIIASSMSTETFVLWKIKLKFSILFHSLRRWFITQLTEKSYPLLNSRKSTKNMEITA